MSKSKQEFSRFFREAQASFSRFYSIALTSTDLTLPQYALLSQLNLVGNMCMTEASKKLHVTKPAITNLVDRLELKKCLKRLTHPKDRRMYLLEILPKGVKFVREIQGRVFHILLATLSEFNPHERELILKFYSHLTNNLTKALLRSTKTEA